MSKRDIRVLLNDILEAIAKVERYTQGLSFEEFSKKRFTTISQLMWKLYGRLPLNVWMSSSRW